MHIQIIAVGKIKEKYLQDGIAEYVKRLRPYVNLQILELAEEKRHVSASVSEEKAAMEKEGERILSTIPSGSFSIALDVRGTVGQAWSLPNLSVSGVCREEPDHVCYRRRSRAFSSSPVPERYATLALEDDVHPPDGPVPLLGQGSSPCMQDQ